MTRLTRVTSQDKTYTTMITGQHRPSWTRNSAYLRGRRIRHTCVEALSRPSLGNFDLLQNHLSQGLVKVSPDPPAGRPSRKDQRPGSCVRVVDQ